MSNAQNHAKVVIFSGNIKYISPRSATGIRLPDLNSTGLWSGLFPLPGVRLPAADSPGCLLQVSGLPPAKESILRSAEEEGLAGYGCAGVGAGAGEERFLGWLRVPVALGRFFPVFRPRCFCFLCYVPVPGSARAFSARFPPEEAPFPLLCAGSR